MKTIAIVGAGGWGTALSITFARSTESLRLWVYEPELCETLEKTRVNPLYLPGVFIPSNVAPTSQLDQALSGAELVLTAVPSQHLRGVCRQMLPLARSEQIFWSATKGLEEQSQLRMSEVIRQTLAPRFTPRLAVLSGPTFAREVAHGLPATVVVASEDEALAATLQKNFSTPAFRLYTNTDVLGVELGGAVKNVIAIAAGVCEGMQLGSNAVAAVITRGLAEMTRLACAMGARRETLYGLGGLGDLVLTATGQLSRNRSAGVEMGRGRSVGDSRIDAHGHRGHSRHCGRAGAWPRHSVEMPITEQMYAMLHGQRSPKDALRDCGRSLKPE
jgi:glycerol-3-phosphate dehydrogenase (NAD(P)+)